MTDSMGPYPRSDLIGLLIGATCRTVIVEGLARAVAAVRSRCAFGIINGLSHRDLPCVHSLDKRVPAGEDSDTGGVAAWSRGEGARRTRRTACFVERGGGVHFAAQLKGLLPVTRNFSYVNYHIDSILLFDGTYKSAIFRQALNHGGSSARTACYGWVDNNPGAIFPDRWDAFESRMPSGEEAGADDEGRSCR